MATTLKYHDEPRHATWLELFFDLVFVATIGVIPRRLTKPDSPAKPMLRNTTACSRRKENYRRLLRSNRIGRCREHRLRIEEVREVIPRLLHQSRNESSNPHQGAQGLAEKSSTATALRACVLYCGQSRGQASHRKCRPEAQPQ